LNEVRGADVVSTDPLHCVPSAGSAWTTVNISEAFPGLHTPLSWTAFSGPCERGVRQGLRDLGGFTDDELEVPERVDDRLLAVFYGRCAGGVDALRMCMDRIPGNSGDKFEQHILGSVRPGLPSHRLLRRYPLAVARATRALVTSTAALRREAALTHGWWARTCVDGRHPGTAATIFGEAQERVERAFRRHMTVRMLGQGMFDAAQNLATRYGPDGCALELATGYGGLDEARMLDDLLRVAGGALALEEFLARFGFHGPAEGDVASRSWREDPAPLDAWITSIRRRGVPYPDSQRSPRPGRAGSGPAGSGPAGSGPAGSGPAGSGLAGTSKTRIAAEHALLAALPAWRRPSTVLLLRLTRHFVVLGELGKATFLRAFDGLRYAARRRGRELVAAGVLAEAEDVFLLTASEAMGGALSRERADELCLSRARTQEEYRGLRLPQSWVGPAPRRPAGIPDGGGPGPSPASDGPAPSPGGAGPASTLTGIAASPGSVTGVARVALDPASVELDDGDVLVCETTDPAWTPYIFRASALVIDVGSSMSHGAIIARELGVPCVAGTRTGTSRIRTGDLITVDGSHGTVALPAPYPEPQTVREAQP
jgi:pyruvate,water dikinase